MDLESNHRGNCVALVLADREFGCDISQLFRFPACNEQPPGDGRPSESKLVRIAGYRGDAAPYGQLETRLGTLDAGGGEGDRE